MSNAEILCGILLLLIDEVLLKSENRCHLLTSAMVIRTQQATLLHSYQGKMYEFFCDELQKFLSNLDADSWHGICWRTWIGAYCCLEWVQAKWNGATCVIPLSLSCCSSVFLVKLDCTAELLLSMTKHVAFIFTAKALLSRYMLWSCVCLSVCLCVCVCLSQSVFY